MISLLAHPHRAGRGPGSEPAGSGVLSGDSSQKRGTATLLTHTRRPRQLRTPNAPRGGGKGDNLLGAPFGRLGAELLRKEEGPRSGAGQ